MARKNIDHDEKKPAVEQANANTSMGADANQSSYADYSRSRCGGALRVAREKQGLSLNDVASKLKISPKQIEAIEADHFSVLPESTIVRGFIRNYAKFLKLEAEPLLDAYNVLMPDQQPLAFMLKPSSTMKVTSYKKPKTGRYIALSMLLLLALAAWLFYQHYIEKPNPTLPTVNSEKLESLPQQALPAAERALPPADNMAPSTEITLPPPASSNATGDNQSSVATPLNTTQTNAAQINTIPAETSATDSATANAQLILSPTTAGAVTVADGGLTRLEIAASQETWVSVKDATGKQIYNKIIFAGSRQAVEAKPPLEVVFGNATGANLTVNGKPFDLAPHTRVNVARLKLE